MLHGHPISASLPEDLGLGERFWYWRGASGQSYIHSIYAVESCPPVAGAIFVLVRKEDGQRLALEVGRFPAFADAKGAAARFPFSDGSHEIHVHLLSRNSDCSEAVLRDLSDALEVLPNMREPGGFHEPFQLELLGA